MKWISKDMETYSQSKEYIDTAVLPLIPLSFAEDVKEAALMSEFISLISTLLERQVAGRILLLPPFTYIKTDDSQKLMAGLAAFTSYLKENHFKHIFLLTSDSGWKVPERELAGQLIWIPALPIDNLGDSQKVELMDTQVKQILALITQKWQEN